MEIVISIVKIALIIVYFYGLFKVMEHSSIWVKILGIVVAFGIVQLALSLQIGNTPILNAFDNGLLMQACTMTMVALGLNLISGCILCG